MDCYQDNTLVVTGSTDVTARILNTNSGKVVSVFDCCGDGKSDANSVEAVGFSNSSA